MSNILIISAVFLPEPVVSAMLSKDIADTLCKENKVVVLCPRPSRPEGFVLNDFSEETRYSVIHLNSFISPASKIFARLRESYSFGKHSAGYIRKNSKDIDAIYINSWPLASQYLIIKQAKKYGIPSILHIQDIYPESLLSKLPFVMRRFLFPLLLPIDKFILGNASKILGISNNMISYLSRTRKVEKSTFQLIRNWQNDEMFLNYSSVHEEQEDFTFMYVGSISASAGVDILIRAFDEANLVKSKLMIVGNGAEKKRCVELAAQINNCRIQFMEVTPEKVPEVQSNANVLLLPLRKGISVTATPSKLTAYLFSGKPIIAAVEIESDVANILNDAGCGLVTEPENIHAIAESMKQIASMKKNQLEEMGENGKSYAILNLSKKANLNKLVGIIEEISICK